MKKLFKSPAFKLLHFTFYIFCFTFLNAQPPPSYSSSEIYLQLNKLNVLGSVLYIAAHPDDENTRLLAYFSKEKQYRTGYLSLTRGDGGQNLIGDEQGIELGLIRTQELLSARRIDGAEQFFSRAYDFGYCKTAQEAMDTWGHDKILSDVVWVIRKFQPDVIITRFPGDERAGHGHHAASSLLANEAFTAAADVKKFPEQFQYGVEPWQAKRIVWNTFNFGGNNTIDSTQFKLDVGVYNNLLGKSYGEIASESRSQHKSQGFGVPRQRGQTFEFFSATGGDAPKNDLMDGVIISWQRVKGGDAIQQQVNNILSQYNFSHPENSVKALVQLYHSIKALPDGYWRNKKLNEVKQLIIECSGLFAEATAGNEYAVQGDSLKLQFFVNKRNDVNIVWKKVQLNSFDSSLNKNLPYNQNTNFTKTMYVSADEKISQPYWLEKPLLSGSFDVSNQQMIGKPENDAAYTAAFTFNIEGTDFIVERPVQYKYTDPVKGEVYQPLRIVPAVTGKLDEPLYVFTNDKTKNVQLQLHSKKKMDSLNVQLQTSNGFKITNNELNTAINANGEATLNATIVNIQPAAAVLSAKGKQHNAELNLLEERKIQYDHIPNILYYKPLTAKLEKIDAVVKGKNIGYIVGAGDKVPQALQQMGYTVSLLQLQDISDEKLKQFDAVVTGIRAYNVHDWLNEKHDVLMRYVENGGNMIVQYNTINFISNIPAQIGPYNFSISRTRVTDEKAEVKILLPNELALNYPNKITVKDFEGWVQERSIYQAEQFDNHFTAPLAMHDANEAESKGSLIIAKYGKGNFVYTGLVFFRELPAGVAGAYRLMANLIGLPQNK